MDCDYHELGELLIGLTIGDVWQRNIQERLLDYRQQLLLNKSIEIDRQYNFSMPDENNARRV